MSDQSQRERIAESQRDALAYESSMYANRLAANITAGIVGVALVFYASYTTNPQPVEYACYAVGGLVFLHFASMVLDNMQSRHSREQARAMIQGQQLASNGSNGNTDQLVAIMLQNLLRLQVNSQLLDQEHGNQMARHETRQIAKVEAPERTYTYDNPDEEFPVIMPGGQKPQPRHSFPVARK